MLQWVLAWQKFIRGYRGLTPHDERKVHFRVKFFFLFAPRAIASYKVNPIWVLAAPLKCILLSHPIIWNQTSPMCVSNIKALRLYTSATEYGWIRRVYCWLAWLALLDLEYYMIGRVTAFQTGRRAARQAARRPFTSDSGVELLWNVICMPEHRLIKPLVGFKSRLKFKMLLSRRLDEQEMTSALHDRIL